MYAGSGCGPETGGTGPRMMDEARRLRSLWRLGDPFPLISPLASSSLIPNMSPQQVCIPSSPLLLLLLLSLSMTHHLPFSSCLLCSLIDEWTLTGYPPCISARCAAPKGPLSLSLSLSRAVHLLILHHPSSARPSLSPLCSLFIKFPFGSRERAKARLNSWADSTAGPRVPEQN